ncbi:MAG: isoprenylcysteine carboxylmethyltransferase family protein [Clostridia bacterium]|nr:isoprenylcysteine carboxylmethyltransferase family protein [Clostridia bacterium]
MKNNGHLPVYGPGPVYVGVIAGLTLVAVCLRDAPLFASGRLHSAVLTVIGVIAVLAGIALWIYAVPVSKIDDGILNNRLVTTGAYALVRNPIYSAAMILCTGVVLILGNAWFFILPVFFWIFMTVLMRQTEEKWLRSLYGSEYEDYCRRVNRCWPWIPKKRS